MKNTAATDMLEALALTANAGAYDSHMNLISKAVSIYGVPGFEVIGYDDWARQCEYEFDEGLLKLPAPCRHQIAFHLLPEFVLATHAIYRLLPCVSESPRPADFSCHPWLPPFLWS